TEAGINYRSETPHATVNRSAMAHIPSLPGSRGWHHQRGREARELAVGDPCDARRTNARRHRGVPVNDAGRRIVAPVPSCRSRLPRLIDSESEKRSEKADSRKILG